MEPTKEPWVVRARNLATDSENRIHDDAVARQYGFQGGLVPGITTYAYMTRPIAEIFGEQWLATGSMTARFVAPIYDGEEITVTPRVHAGDEDALDVEVTNASGDVCAVGTARLSHHLPDSNGPAAPSPADYPVRDLPDARPPVSRAVLDTVGTLGAVRRTFHLERAPEFLSAIGDDLDLYDRVAHPGWIIYDANAILVQNVLLAPWVHVGSDVRHFSTVGDGDVVSTRGRVASLFDRRGHEFVELDLAMFADDGLSERPVWGLRHTAIYRLGTAEG